MSNDPIKDLVDYRLSQARETLQEAEGLFHLSLWRGTINRSYYAMFYAVLALAVLRQQVTSKHSSVMAFFDREFVRTGVFPKDLSQVFHRSFESRQSSDYGETFTVNDEEAQQAVQDAHKFVTAIENYVTSIFPANNTNP